MSSSRDDLIKHIHSIISGNVSNNGKKHTLKSIGNNPISLNLNTYIMDILPQIDDYYITDKADGQRCLIVVKDKKLTYITGDDMQTYPVSVELGETIMDSEYIISPKNGQSMFYVFDVIKYNDNNVSNEPFSNRLKYIDELQKKKITIKKDIILEYKKYYKLTTGNYAKEILKLNKELKSKPYNTDGIIFTSGDKSYSQTKNYKWKPVDHLTIDFLCMTSKLESNDSNGYILFSGINKKLYQNINLDSFGVKRYLPLIKSYIKTDAQNNIVSDFIPVPFMPSLKHNAFKYSPSKDDTGKFPKDGINNKICEFSYDVKKNQWIFHRIRSDRDEDLAAGKYFGNYFQVSESIWQSIYNPITLKELTAQLQYLQKDVYFSKTSDKHKHVRKYNNYVKEQLIKKYSNTEKILDLASGKGQDLWKYANAQIKNVLMVEQDINAIDKIIELKYKIFNTSQNYKTGLNVIPFDLTNDWQNLVKLVKADEIDFIYGENSVPLIICNLALHYLISTPADLKNMTELINYYLRKDGDFLFTCLNRDKVNKLIEKSPKNKWEVKENGQIIYSVAKATGKSAGKKADDSDRIAIYLPCSENEMEETLINLFTLDKAFKPFGIIRVEQGGFSDYFNTFQQRKKDTYNELSATDKEFIDLYQYVIYKKIKM